jgi:class 3 adenylate cyclase
MTRTVVVVDLVESVRLIAHDEEGTVRRWQTFVHEVVTRSLPEHGGRLVKRMGDGLMLEFESVPPAIRCTLDMFTTLAAHSPPAASPSAMRLRASAHVTDVIVDEHDLYGAGVNLAARLLQLADPGGIVVSGEVRDRLVPGLDAEVEDLGECYLKHIDEPVRAHRLSPPPAEAAWMPPMIANALRPAIAVVPFDAPNQDAMQQLLGDAVADELIASLSRSPELTVVSRLSTSVFRGRAGALPSIRTHLRADYVLAGTMHIANERLRLVVELTEATSAKVVWAGDVRGSVPGVFSGDDPMVHDLTHRVCSALARRQVERARREPLATLESYCLLMAAVNLLHGTAWHDFDRAREMLEHLVDRDRRHAAPHAWLAKWVVMRVQQGWSSAMRRDTSRVDCTRRAGHRPRLFAVAGDLLLRALQPDERPDGAAHRYELRRPRTRASRWRALQRHAACVQGGGPAVHAAERALGSSPLDPMRYFFESLTATAPRRRQYERTIEHARALLHRTHTSTLRAMAIAQVQLGRLEEARETVRALMVLEPHLTISGYLDRSPSSGFATGKLWSDSLAAAGVPAT